MRKNITLIVPIIIGLLTGISANAASIKGYIYDKKTNEPVIGAIVMLMNQNIGVHTDFDGRFVISDVQSDQDRLHVKSLGHSSYMQTVTFANDSATIDVGIIHLKKARSKHYNRLSLSYNPQLIPTICSHQKMFYNSYGETGFSASVFHGYNISDRIGIELGAKYNYTYNTQDTEEFHSYSKHHSVSVFANVAYNVALNNFVISPYIGFYTRKYLYSKLCYENTQRHVVYDMTTDMEEKWFNPGAQVGLGLKYGKLYLGAELGCDFNQERTYYIESSQGNSDKFYYEYSFSVGFEF